MPPGKAYMAAEYLTWPEFAAAWQRVTGASIVYKEVSFDEMVAAMPDPDLGVEVGLMFVYSSEPGYDGKMDLLKAEDLRKVSYSVKVVEASERGKKDDADFVDADRRASTARCTRWSSRWPRWTGRGC